MAKENNQRGLTPTLKTLVDKIKATGGFEVYAHDGTPVVEKTDTPVGYTLDRSNLHFTRRASQNLRDPLYMGSFADNCFYDVGGRPASYESHLGMVTSGVVSRLELQSVEVPGKLVQVQVPQEGILGYLGFKKTESVRRPNKTTKLSKVGYFSLNEIINTPLDSPAGCIITNILSDFKDGSGRINGNPNLIVYCTPELRGEIFDFLKANPASYNAYHNALLTKDLFPNINRTMLAQMREPSEISFLICNSKLENVSREANGYMGRDIPKIYGQTVRVASDK